MLLSNIKINNILYRGVITKLIIYWNDQTNLLSVKFNYKTWKVVDNS